jgi:hypothetical protein
VPTGEGDREAITSTVMDYFEGWFEGDAARMERALHPDLAKRGARVEASGVLSVVSMTAEEMIGWTRDGEGTADRPEDLAIRVDVHDIEGGIATVSVHSTVYVEYLHLVRTADGWKILNALYRRVEPR